MVTGASPLTLAFGVLMLRNDGQNQPRGVLIAVIDFIGDLLFVGEMGTPGPAQRWINRVNRIVTTPDFQLDAVPFLEQVGDRADFNGILVDFSWRDWNGTGVGMERLPGLGFRPVQFSVRRF